MTIEVQKPTASMQVSMQALANMDAEVLEYNVAMQTILLEYYASMGILVMNYGAGISTSVVYMVHPRMTLLKKGGATMNIAFVCSTGIGEVYVLMDKDAIPILTIDGGYIFLSNGS
jgi:hypothetical protein